jgi:hypothetical protein
MAQFHDNALIGAAGQGGSGGGYQISRSLRFNSADSAYLSRTPASAGNRTTWTWAGWVKRSSAGGFIFSNLLAGASSGFFVEYVDTLKLGEYAGGSPSWQLETVSVFRDPCAWYAFQIVFDTTQATAANRIRVYVNGVQVTSFSGSSPSQNSIGSWNNTNLHTIGRNGSNPQSFSGYLADIHFIDGQALTPSSFGAFDSNNVWQPKAYTGTYGTNGFKLDFADNSSNTATTLGKDTSGNGNNWTPNNLSVTAGAGNDSFVDTPTNYGTDTGAGGEVRGNYATWNALAGTGTLSNGNLDCALQKRRGGTVSVSSGKWYWEIAATSVTAAGCMIGVIPAANINLSSVSYIGDAGRADEYGYYSSGSKFSNGSSAYGASYTTGDVIGVALNLDTGTITFYKNGVSQGQAFSGVAGTYTPAVCNGSGGATDDGSATANFGQRPFAYTAPSGFKALCTQNLPTPTILNGATVMDTVLYTGTGASLTPTSSLGFSPDLVWIKGRSAATDHALYDTVRGVQLDIGSNLATAETTQSTGLTAFNSNGFTVGTLAKLNTSAATYAGWCWDAGTSNVVNTQGSITSTVRANPSAGFSVVTYTGTGANATVGHGLGVAPQFLIVKQRNGINNWWVYHQSLGASQYINLETTGAAATAGTVWNNTNPTSTVFSIGSVTSNGNTVAYCFAPVAGYSSFGSYTGNGNASNDGPFVYTGFRPRWVMIKSTSSGNWTIFDALRVGYNVDNEVVYPNLASGSGVDNDRRIDILSNGFKIRNTAFGSTDINGTTATTYIYAAFAEAPFQYARAR